MAKTPSRSALLARDLLGRIARRELRPGDPIDLPALGRRHGVSRTVVREALADLGGKGLVVARPKVGTTIAPESEWNLLDPVLVAAAIAEPGPESMLPEATELRRVIEPALAAAAARDAGRAQHAAILESVRALAGAVGQHDRGAWANADAALHAAIAAACGNRLLRSVDHALEPVRAQHRLRLLGECEPGGPFAAAVLRRLEAQTALGLAIVRRDAERACALATALAPAAHAPATASVPARPAVTARTDTPRAAPTEARPAAPAEARNGTATAASAHGQPNRADTPAVVPAAAPPVPAFVVAPTVRPAPEPWPETETMVHALDPFAPLRRGRLDPEEAMPQLAVPTLARPVLAADRPRETVSRAGLH
jgi:DNA-binding FadR family transcriptional regulator